MKILVFVFVLILISQVCSLLPEEREALQTVVNEERARFCFEPVVYDLQIEVYAQAWADECPRFNNSYLWIAEAFGLPTFSFQNTWTLAGSREGTNLDIVAGEISENVNLTCSTLNQSTPSIWHYNQYINPIAQRFACAVNNTCPTMYRVCFWKGFVNQNAEMPTCTTTECDATTIEPIPTDIPATTEGGDDDDDDNTADDDDTTADNGTVEDSTAEGDDDDDDDSFAQIILISLTLMFLSLL